MSHVCADAQPTGLGLILLLILLTIGLAYQSLLMAVLRLKVKTSGHFYTPSRLQGNQNSSGLQWEVAY